MTGGTLDGSTTRETYGSVLRRLAAAQKPAARSAPAYSRFVNRRLGRYLTAWAYRAGLTPNGVTAISAAWTFAALILLVVFPPSWLLGIGVALMLLIGYAFDSADGQLSRLTGRSSPAGEWLDHMVDATKVVSMPLALGLGLYLHDAVPVAWLLVPLFSAVISSVLFFGMILTEQLRRQHGRVSLAADAPGRPSWMRAVLVLPMDYGVLCLSFVLLGWVPGFLVLYTLIVLATTLFLFAAAVTWFRELRSEGGRP
ncbi:CDP-alcohol phosphatidyltransferase [Leifsonia sp. 98AMF]|uniref:CDP-alcohol phosphatidyltransferase family protein n=1 Tax=unclassified Leifsonia TaxID=2663824 RepID=UPI00087CF9CF|nr:MULTISPECIES: CDP-alcohol phosphatidyltransferase family protein [unclassified Leifsonia]SDH64255.1 CDP-alcohol phosphatidyltransferase [Leifsonia sp. 197AMF]SDI75204.1 CDP-alcohol phosphatidyltransferase [Leifsonia sp. 466MF]SDK12529.1 CDP-alcohol phosphatidyltransferase [Leifsonia sp. 157MF]SDN78391.1 CDP-alcohol phosphatidyltransferase [Leifsonia sp. 509MF]SEN29193.1 CDP-alcohol phosphatidyltransferase [Leifsonia sp. 467MF]